MMAAGTSPCVEPGRRPSRAASHSEAVNVPAAWTGRLCASLPRRARPAMEPRMPSQPWVSRNRAAAALPRVPLPANRKRQRQSARSARAEAGMWRIAILSPLRSPPCSSARFGACQESAAIDRTGVHRKHSPAVPAVFRSSARSRRNGPAIRLPHRRRRVPAAGVPRVCSKVGTSWTGARCGRARSGCTGKHSHWVLRRPVPPGIRLCRNGPGARTASRTVGMAVRRPRG